MNKRRHIWLKTKPLSKKRMNSLYQSQIGKSLRQAREEMGYSLFEASNILHIRAHYLQALETGELSVLPGPAYAKGYLITYATLLHLDKDEILRRYEMTEGEAQDKNLFFPQVFSNEQSPSNLMVWGGVGMVIIIYLLWYFIYSPQIEKSSLVEPPPPFVEVFKEYNIAGSVLNLPCAAPSVKLYPACYRMPVAKLKNKADQRKKKSIMELAN